MGVDLTLAALDRALAGENEEVDPREEENAADRLGRLFDIQHRRLYALARRMSDDPEESRDLVQEAFLRAAQRYRSIPDQDAAAEAWLVRILVNLCHDRWRRLRTRRRADLAPLAEWGGRRNPESAAIARATVEAALGRLSPRQRAIIVLHELEGRGTREVAETLGIRQVTVRWHLSAARKELKRLLFDDGDD
jgi:RNA polymerase sigma-70 factor (ECF subfamily)